jgi:DNA-binding response OmpR family regulator
MPKVLLCEDDEMMVSLLQTLLQMEGFEVVQTNRNDTSDEIIDKIRREQPAIIILDVHLHKVDGFDLLKRLRQTEDLKSVRVLIASGMDYSSRSIEEGANGFIMKPYMPDELIASIRRILD